MQQKDSKSNLVRSISSYEKALLSKKWALPLVLTFCFVWFMITSQYLEFEDELHNILGGLFLHTGGDLYRDYISQHGPFAFYLSYLITFVSGNSYVKFRLISSLLFFALFSGVTFYIRRAVSSGAALTFAVITALVIPRLWAHMFLAETWIAYLMLTGSLVLYSRFAGQMKKPFSLWELSLFSAIVFSSVLSSIAFIYASIVLTGAVAYLQFRMTKNRVAPILQVMAFFAAPWIVFFIVFAAKGLLQDFWFFVYRFNTEYYSRIAFVPRTPFEGVVYIFTKFFIQTGKTLLAVLDRSKFPSVFIVLSLIFSLGHDLRRGHYEWALFCLLFSITLAVRSVFPGDLAAAFHDTPFIFFVIFLFARGIVSCGRNLSRVFLVLGLIWIYAFIGINFRVGRDVLTQKTVRVTDTSPGAELFNLILTEQDYAWPAFPGYVVLKDQLSMRAKLATRYAAISSVIMACARCQSEIFSDLAWTKPKIIVIDETASFLGVPFRAFGGTLVDYLNKNYVPYRCEMAPSQPGIWIRSESLGEAAFQNRLQEAKCRRDKPL